MPNNYRTTDKESQTASNSGGRFKSLVYSLFGVASVGALYALFRQNGLFFSTATFSLNIEQNTIAADGNSAPLVIGSVQNQLLGINTPFSIALNSRDIFVDPDGDVLKITVVAEDGESLPEWLGVEVDPW